MITPLRRLSLRYYRDLVALGHSPAKAWALVVKKMGLK